MKIHQIFFKNSLRNFCYLIFFSDGAIYCIDPFRANEVLDFLGQQRLAGIINTHDHCDHHSGNASLIENFSCQVMAHPGAQILFKNRQLQDYEVIHQSWENETLWSLKAIFTPGHTLTHLCLLLEKNNDPYALFTGDCFFNAGVGNCHNGGDPLVLYQTISQIFSHFPDELLIYPGHEYLKRNLEFTQKVEPQNSAAQLFLKKLEALNLDETFFTNSMKTEREINTFLRLSSVNLRENLELKKAHDQDVFLTLREMRNRW